jgi:hypothetical protein
VCRPDSGASSSQHSILPNSFRSPAGCASARACIVQVNSLWLPESQFHRLVGPNSCRSS